jgi:hypothetical protein
MAIDLLVESTIPLKEAANVLPRRNGKRINFSTLWRWSMRGVRGVKLETLRIGGTLATSHEALQRFADALTASDSQLFETPPTTQPKRRGRPPKIRTVNQRERDVQAAEARLGAAGI